MTKKTNQPLASGSTLKVLGTILQGLDLTEIFKEKGRGNLKRWSAKRTLGGVIVITACHQIELHGLTWEGVILALVGTLPLLLSVARNP